MSEIAQKLCITGFPQLWKLKSHNSVGDRHTRAAHASGFSAESDVTRLAEVISSGWELLPTNCWDARTKHSKLSLWVLWHRITSLWTYSGEVGADLCQNGRKTEESLTDAEAVNHIFHEDVQWIIGAFEFWIEIVVFRHHSFIFYV